MSLNYNELVGKVVSFTLYAPPVLGDGYSRVKIIGVVSADVALAHDDIISKHAQVYGSLPPGTVDNYAAYDYLLIKNANGNIVPIGIPWISSAVDVFESSMTTVVIPNLNAVQIKELEYVLRSNQFTGFTISTTTVT